MKRRHQKKKFRFLKYMLGDMSVADRVYNQFRGNVRATVEYMKAMQKAGYLELIGQRTVVSLKGMKFIQEIAPKNKKRPTGN